MAKNASSSSSSSSSSGSSGFGLHALLKSKAKGGRLATEAQLLQQAAAGAAITPDDVLALAAPTSSTLPPLLRAFSRLAMQTPAAGEHCRRHSAPNIDLMLESLRFMWLSS